jgi:hypothetical protein
MPQEETSPGEGFVQKLSRLRTRIDHLPPEQRPHLYELADAIFRQHWDLEDRKSSKQDSR